MEYAFIWKDKSGKEVVKELSSGCWGATGRLDQYFCKINSDLVRAGLPYSFSVRGKGGSSSYFQGYPDATHVRIRHGHSGYNHVFRKEMYDIMDYFVHRSPFRVLFHQQWSEQFKANSLDFNCSTVPAMITIIALIWLRDRMYSSAGLTFSTLVQAGIPEGIAFVTAVNCPELYAGSAGQYGAHGAEAMPYDNDYKWDLGFFCNPECTVETWNEHWRFPQQSCTELGGYPTCMMAFWSYPKTGPKQLTVGKFQSGHRKFMVNRTINGLFGPFSFHGCTDPVGYTKYIWGLE